MDFHIVKASYLDADLMAFIEANRERYVIVNDAYANSFNRPERYQIFYGGAAAGKSDFKATDLLIKAIKKPFFRLLYVRKVYKDIRNSQFELFVSIIKRQKWEKYFTFSEADNSNMVITCNLNGNKIIPAGLDKSDSLTSITDITDVWFEEPLVKGKHGKAVTQDDFTEVDRRLRTQKASTHLHFTFNPIGTQNFVYQNFFDTEGGKAREYGAMTYTLKTTFKDNFFIDREAENKKFLKQGAYDYRVFALGEWGLLKAKSPYFYEFSMDKHVYPLVYNPEKPYILAFDFNLDVMSTSVWQLSRDYGKIYNVGEFAPVQGLEQRIKTILSSPFAKDLAYCHVTGDATGQHRNQVNPFTNHYNILKESLNLRGSQFKVATHNILHKDSRLLCNSVIRNGDFCINTDSINLQSDFQSTEADGEDGIMKKVYDPHYGDGFRAVAQNFLMQYLAETLRK